MTKYIAIAGTHSTGKSTLAAALSQGLAHAGKSCDIISDKATECRKVGFPILTDHTFESTLWIMTTVIQSELELSLSCEIGIVDRPVFDALAYLEAALISSGRSIARSDRDYLYTLARLHCQKYDYIFRTNLDESIPIGPGRDDNIHFRVLVDEKLGEVVQELDLTFVSHDQGNTECDVKLAVQSVCA